jgi:hypothetical protein
MVNHIAEVEHRRCGIQRDHLFNSAEHFGVRPAARQYDAAAYGFLSTRGRREKKQEKDGIDVNPFHAADATA